jgi:regulator of cell morphogenesis and NO signaling
MSVREACAAHGLDPRALLSELDSAIQSRQGVETRPDPRQSSTASLIAVLIDRHHRYLREALPFVKPLAAKVARVHGDHNPALRDVDRLVGELAEALLPHLDDEESRLFPAMMAGHHVELGPQLASMHAEHLEVGELLAQMRRATNDYGVPEWACNSYRTLFAELATLETDTLHHVHLENHVLAPRFVT